jgi:hypothetical protein
MMKKKFKTKYFWTKKCDFYDFVDNVMFCMAFCFSFVFFLFSKFTGIKEKVHLEKRDSTTESNKKIIVTTNAGLCFIFYFFFAFFVFYYLSTDLFVFALHIFVLHFIIIFHFFFVFFVLF